MAHGCPDTGINDPTVGSGLRTIGLDRMKLNAAVVKIDNGATPITLIKGARSLIFLYSVQINAGSILIER
jgi:hypothetical protein